MDTHQNAPLTPKGREAMVRSVLEEGLSKAAAARQFNTTAKTVAKWVERFGAEGVEGLRDRSSRPLSLPSQTPPATCAAVENDFSALSGFQKNFRSTPQKDFCNNIGAKQPFACLSLRALH